MIKQFVIAAKQRTSANVVTNVSRKRKQFFIRRTTNFSFSSGRFLFRKISRPSFSQIYFQPNASDRSRFNQFRSSNVVELGSTCSTRVELEFVVFIRIWNCSKRKSKRNSKKNLCVFVQIEGRPSIKLNLGGKRADLYSGNVQLSDGIYHVIKIVRQGRLIQLFVDGVEIQLDGPNRKLFVDMFSCFKRTNIKFRSILKSNMDQSTSIDHRQFS